MSGATRRKIGQPTFPTLFFRDGILSIPGYTFEKALPWEDTGSMTVLAEGNSLKDGSNVLAKIAPAQSNGSMCLEREAHILGKMASITEGSTVALRMIDYLQIPREHGDCAVLLLVHPGSNVLSRYLPPSKINSLLLPDSARPRPTSSHGGDFFLDGNGLADQLESSDTMDLATFLEFAIQSTHCLEVMHMAGIVHREVRANAFHLNSHSGLVRFVHFGNRAISLENFGSPSSLVLRAYEEAEKVKIKEALCYLAPEQTGSIETMSQDHRTDLYSLGILFWTLLVGRGQMPFEGGALELLHSVVQKRPMPVHEVRRDVPQVIADIIDKLLTKNPDMRYQSAHGLKTDLMECQRRLLVNVSGGSDESSELIPTFEIGKEDRFMEFTMPMALFGRDKELEIIRNVIRHASTSFSRHHSATRGYISVFNNGTHQSKGTSVDDTMESYSSRSNSPNRTTVTGDSSSHLVSTSELHDFAATSAAASMDTSGGLRRAAISARSRVSRTQAILVVGPPGIGKSSIVLVNQAKWRSHGLWGQAKFQSTESAPFAALLSCLSSVLRQLMVFHTDLERFVTELKSRLGPQLQNVPLLYQGTPELKDVLAQYGLHLEIPHEPLHTKDSELRARFQSLVESVFAVIADTRLFALFLDDLHEADESTLDLVSALINSRSRMLIFATLRSDRVEVVERVKDMFSGRSKPTWINVEPLPATAVATLVSKTLHRSKEETAPLSEFIYNASFGNAFSARSIMTAMHRQRHIVFCWDTNNWDYDMDAIKASLSGQKAANPSDLSFLITQMRQFPEDARKYLIWATFFGETFKVTEVALMMDWEDSSVGSASEDEIDDMHNLHKAVSNLRENGTGSTRGSMRGLQRAVTEGWLVTRAREMCSFSHDRYRQAAQAEAEALPQDVKTKMSFRIILMMLHESPVDVYRVAEHSRRCIDLLQNHPKKDELVDVLMDAGESAWARGAHELAIQSFTSAKILLQDQPWKHKPERTYNLFIRLAALYAWQYDIAASNVALNECINHCTQPEERASILRLRARNKYLDGKFSDALDDTLNALKILGVDVNPAPSRRQADYMFEQVKNEIMAVGFDEIINIPRTNDPRTELAVLLLNDAGMNAFWSSSPLIFADVIGLTTIQLTLRSGMSPGTALGFFWALGERRDMHRFAVDLAKLALRIAERHGSSGERCRAYVLYCAMISGFDSVHVRSVLPLLQQASQHGESSGDRLYTAFASIHMLITRLFVADPISELLSQAEECVGDIKVAPAGDTLNLAIAVLNCIRVLGGHTDTTDVTKVFNTDQFDENAYLKAMGSKSGNAVLSLSWYDAFRVVSFFCVGHIREAAVLGFDVYKTRDAHPNHRHVRWSLFYHSLSLIASVRNGWVTGQEQGYYLSQVHANQNYIRKWLAVSPVNNNAWVAIVDAELASLHRSPDAFRLYDMAVTFASTNDWPAEEGWALFLQGAHFRRCGVENLGSELQRRGITRHDGWGAAGIVKYLTSIADLKTPTPTKGPSFSCDVAVQTEVVPVTYGQPLHMQTHTDDIQDDDSEESSLSASDLASILKWSKDISSDINLSSALRRLTEIGTETSNSQHTCVVIAREAGDYIVATSMTPPEPCQVHEHPLSIRSLNDPLARAIIQHTLNSKERVYSDDASHDPRFSAEAAQTIRRATVCLPIFGNRGQTFGVIYFSSRYTFNRNTVTVLTLLCQQASISISNALLFRSVQAGTRENLKMIAAQKEALEEARKSRENAVKATKTKSNFLASMSHELRTPFSSFYGLLDLLSGTELNPGQSEIVQTAKQSCELLLKIIDSILDYSKLEASAVKLEPSGFLVENIIADCMELLLPMAAKKLDLAFNIEPNVPTWVYADYARIRQVLMNLIGNAVKFTPRGSVRVTCLLETAVHSSTSEVHIKFEIRDTGIGLAASDVDLLFVPFQQADNSSTRRFGGTGLGLSISRQLVKLMGGAIGVTSEPDRGSMFWFTIPVGLFKSAESEMYAKDIETMRSALLKHRPLRVLLCSESPTTLALLSNMLQGFSTHQISKFQEMEIFLRNYPRNAEVLDFVILDSQDEQQGDNLAGYLRSKSSLAFRDTKVIHLYTPTTNSGQVFATNKMPNIVRMTKPPRQAKILQTLAGLKNIQISISIPTSEITKAKESLAAAQRTLFGNVLIAEDNPIAQELLIKQLQRHQLQVVATSNGEEAITEWESREPGFFTVALFDHHMPVLDGVEAAKRIRMLERKRKVTAQLPIVALSADCQESTKKLCLSAGMNAFFSKPLKKGDLMSLLSMFGSGPSPG